MSRIELIGICGKGLNGEQWPMLRRCSAIVASRRHRPLVADLPAPIIEITPVAAMLDQVEAILASGDVAVLASGDPLFYGIGRTLIDRFGPERISIHPALSAVQLACARFRQPWDDLALISLHGRPADDLPGQVLRHRKALLFTDGRNTPNRVAASLMAALTDCADHERLAAIRIRVAENIGLVDEHLTSGTLADNPGGYKLVSTTCGATLAAGQTCKYTLKYTAQTPQPAAARLELTTLNSAFPLLKLPLQANRYPALNDTGITRCSNLDQNGLTCPVPDYPGQDAQYGRDKTRNVARNGKAGFNYTKLDSKGKTLPAKATSWDCVRDNVTGLVWEKKPTGDGTLGNQGLHDADDFYTWYSTDSKNNGGDPGAPNELISRQCFGYQANQPDTYCNTEAYVNRVNAAGWCGFKDWRLPDRFELRGLVDLSVPEPGPTIDESYFPDTISYDYGDFWASSPFAGSAATTWYVDFRTGISNFTGRVYLGKARLVRGGQ